MMHGRFRPDEIVAATRMRVIPAPVTRPTEPSRARPPRSGRRDTLRATLWQRRYRTRRAAPELDAA